MRQLSLRAMVLALGLAGVVAFSAAPAVAQAPGEDLGMAAGRGQFAGMQRIQGEVTAVSGDTISIKTEDGSAMKVATTSNTRVMMGRGEPMKIADVKVGDGVMAMGNLDAPNKTLHAVMMGVTDAETVKKLKENLGKTYIAGKVTAIDADNAKLTVLRPDGVSQTIGLDEGTSFKRGGRGVRMGGGMGPGGGTGGGGSAQGANAQATAGSGESITLADVKVGDNVTGQGSLKSGVFVPGQLNVSTPRPRREGGAAAAAAGAGAAPAGAAKPQ